MSSESFGPKLRWRRIREGVSLEQISAHTKVPVELWEAMEADNFAAWPTGLYARAYVRDYANMVGLDADAVVDDFCRLFPQKGDRRREGLVRGQAQIVGHRFASVDTPLPPGVTEDRRASRSSAPPDAAARRRTAIDVRVAAAILDQCLVIVLAAVIGIGLRNHFWMVLALVALVYHGAGVAAAGCSPGAWTVRTYLARHPRPTPNPDVFAALPRTTTDHS